MPGKCLFAVLLGLFPLSALAAVISGRVLGEDGKPMRKASAQLYTAARGNAFDRVETDSNGRFTLRTDRQGIVVLKLAGVGHMTSSAILPLDQAESIAVQARLQRPALFDVDWAESLLFVEGSKNGVKLVKRAEGAWAAEVETSLPAPTVRIATGTPGSRNFTLTDAAEYRLKDQGYFTISVHEAVVLARNGKVTVVLDPTRLRPSQRPPALTVKGLARQYSHLKRPWHEMEQRWRRKPDPALAPQQIELARQTLAAAESPLERELAWLNLADALQANPPSGSEDGLRLMNEVRPDSPAWVMLSGGGSAFQKLLIPLSENKTVDRYIAAVEAALPADSLEPFQYQRFYALLNQKRFDEMRPILARLDRAEEKTGYGKNMLNRVGGVGMLTVPGRKLPAWQAQDFSDPGKTYSHEVLLAKARVYLLDFWASW